jgi:hypothetical protein
MLKKIAKILLLKSCEINKQWFILTVDITCCTALTSCHIQLKKNDKFWALRLGQSSQILLVSETKIMGKLYSGPPYIIWFTLKIKWPSRLRGNDKNMKF